MYHGKKRPLGGRSPSTRHCLLLLLLLLSDPLLSPLCPSEPIRPLRAAVLCVLPNSDKVRPTFVSWDVWSATKTCKERPAFVSCTHLRPPPQLSGTFIATLACLANVGFHGDQSSWVTHLMKEFCCAHPSAAAGDAVKSEDTGWHLTGLRNMTYGCDMYTSHERAIIMSHMCVLMLVPRNKVHDKMPIKIFSCLFHHMFFKRHIRGGNICLYAIQQPVVTTETSLSRTEDTLEGMQPCTHKEGIYDMGEALPKNKLPGNTLNMVLHKALHIQVHKQIFSLPSCKIFMVKNIWLMMTHFSLYGCQDPDKI